MTKLKTLKDLENYFQISDGETEGKYKIVISEDLRKEAIKLIKACYDGCSKDFRCKACKRDMWFYGIIEEDLE